jgi:paraquat-inducible protein A
MPGARYSRLGSRRVPMSQREQVELIGCPDCGLIQSLPPIADDAIAECARCRHVMAGPQRADFDSPLAFAASALLLLLPAILAPLMRLSAFGRQREDWLPSGIGALWSDGFAPLAVVVFLFSIAIPFLYLGLMIWVLAALRRGGAQPLGREFRWALRLRPWAMLEVYLVGCCVAYSRLQSIGPIQVDAGGWCLLGGTAAVFLLSLSLDERSIWNALQPRVEPTATGRTISCDACGLVLDASREHASCPRCAATLRRRKPYSMASTLALVLTGYLLYLPANVLPMIRIERFGRDEPNTILGGVRALVSSGLWPLAAIVFTASIVVPLMKLLGLSAMMAFTSRRSRRWLIGRTRLYRFIDAIGRWSSIDLFMISILVALVQFGTLTSVRPDEGAVAFAAVVIVTMLASRSFDPRIMWDATEGAS